MATITLKGNPIHTVGELPATGSSAPDFELTRGDLGVAHLADYAGKRKVLNIVPSLDTGICAMSAKTFNERVGASDETVLLTISADLPFAQGRFCESEKLAHVVMLSSFRSPEFGAAYGVTITDGPLAGLLSRAVIVLDATDRVVYAEQVPEIAQEPDYDAALAALGA